MSKEANSNAWRNAIIAGVATIVAAAVGAAITVILDDSGPAQPIVDVTKPVSLILTAEEDRSGLQYLTVVSEFTYTNTAPSDSVPAVLTEERVEYVFADAPYLQTWRFFLNDLQSDEDRGHLRVNIAGDAKAVEIGSSRQHVTHFKPTETSCDEYPGCEFKNYHSVAQLLSKAKVPGSLEFVFSSLFAHGQIITTICNVHVNQTQFTDLYKNGWAVFSCKR